MTRRRRCSAAHRCGRGGLLRLQAARGPPMSGLRPGSSPTSPADEPGTQVPQAPAAAVAQESSIEGNTQ
jgi:hypothetical protein